MKLLTLDEAAAILRVRDTRTVLSWGRQGRFKLIGERKSITVNAESLQAYIEGRSAWHEKRQRAASPAPERSATGQAQAMRQRELAHVEQTCYRLRERYAAGDLDLARLQRLYRDVIAEHGLL